MAAVTGKLEVEFVPGSGTWVDLSSRMVSMDITHPRSGSGIAPSPTTLVAVLQDHPDASGFSPLNPESPAAAYYPNLKRDRRVRGSAVYGGGPTTTLRFSGWADTWVPDAANGEADKSTVTLTASCVISRYARRQVLSEYGETLVALALVDYWPYGESADATTLRGIASDAIIPAATVITTAAGQGTLSLSKPDSVILVDGSATLSRGAPTMPSPVILHRLRAGQTIARVSAWIRLEQDLVGSDDDVMGVYNAAGGVVWRLVAAVSGGNIVWQIIDSSSTVAMSWNTGSPRDDTWHWFSMIPFSAGANLEVQVRDKAIIDRLVMAGAMASDARVGAYLVVGGRMNPLLLGKQSNTVQGSISSVYVQYGSEGPASYSDRSSTYPVWKGNDRSTMISSYTTATDAIVGGGLGAGTLDLTAVRLTGSGPTALDCWIEHQATTGGVLTTLPSGRRQWTTALNLRPTTVALTLDASADLHMPAGGWQQIHDERPTRVTVSSPAGQVTVIDSATEALTGLTLEGPALDTAAGSIDVAKNAGAWLIAAAGARISSVGVDATLTATDKTAAIMALNPGDRVRVSGLPTSYGGVSYMDFYATGWVETYVADGNLCQFIFDTDPADSPPEMRFDDAEYGRMALDAGATVTGGTCVGNTGTGTVIITTTSPLTTTGGEYSMDLDWNGERVTVSVPGGSTSPQTVTVTARGVAPSVARVHATGESVDIWHAWTFGL